MDACLWVSTIFAGAMFALYAALTVCWWAFGEPKTLVQLVASQCRFVWRLLGRVW